MEGVGVWHHRRKLRQMIELVIRSILLGGATKYLHELRPNNAERLRLWKFGMPWMAMPIEPEACRHSTSLEMLCQMTLWAHEAGR
jgi:hypothetical protein